MESAHEAATQSKHLCDPLLGHGPPVEKRWPRIHICDEC